MAGAVVIALVLAGMVGWAVGVRSGARTDDPAASAIGSRDFGPAPRYEGLTNQLGESIGSDRFRGRVQVVTLLFPYCTTDCPLVAAHLAGFAQTLRVAGLQDRVAIVTFNIDPAGAGPAQMREFLRQYGWDPQDTSWQYLTGSPDVIRRVVTGGFHLYYGKVPDDTTKAAAGPPTMPQPEVVNPLARRAHPGYDVAHSDVIVLVGPRGHIRRIDPDAEFVTPSALLTQVQSLLPGPAS